MTIHIARGIFFIALALLSIVLDYKSNFHIIIAASLVALAIIFFSQIKKVKQRRE